MSCFASTKAIPCQAERAVFLPWCPPYLQVGLPRLQVLGDRQVPLVWADFLMRAPPLHQQLPVGAEHPAVDGAVQQAWGACEGRWRTRGGAGQARRRGSRGEVLAGRPQAGRASASPSRWHKLRSWRPMTQSCSSTSSNHSPSSSARAAAAAAAASAAVSPAAAGAIDRRRRLGVLIQRASCRSGCDHCTAPRLAGCWRGRGRAGERGRLQAASVQRGSLCPMVNRLGQFTE